MSGDLKKQLRFCARISAIVIGIPLVLILLLVVANFTLFRDRILEGPVSEKGLKTQVYVSDRGWTPGADFESDVVILDTSGHELARWVDDQGGYGDKGAEKLLNSIIWLDATTVKFKPMNREEVTLTTKPKER